MSGRKSSGRAAMDESGNIVQKRQAPETANLVFILPDRLRQDTSAAYGNDWIASPHMDRLATESFVFENAYVTQPVSALRRHAAQSIGNAS
jgi:arylsulfatase A-like enzyme